MLIVKYTYLSKFLSVAYQITNDLLDSLTIWGKFLGKIGNLIE